MPHAVFDLDGTLIDSAPAFVGILNAMLADRGAALQLTEAQVRPHATAGGRAMVAALLGEGWGDPDQALAEFRRRYAAEPTPPACLYPGARRALADLGRRGITLSIFSNKPQHLCEKVVGELGLSPVFAAVVGSGPHAPLKPDPAGLDLALAQAGGERANGCYIGDSDADFALARRAGVPVVMVRWGYGDGAADWPGAGVADAFDEVPSLVARALRLRQWA